jgi:hypothetical protein
VILAKITTFDSLKAKIITNVVICPEISAIVLILPENSPVGLSKAKIRAIVRFYP